VQRRGDEITQDDLGRPVVRQQDLGRRGDVAGLLQPGAPGQADPGPLRRLFPRSPGTSPRPHAGWRPAPPSG